MQVRSPIAISLGALALACASGASDGSSVIFSDESGTPSAGAWVTISCACLVTPIDLATDDTGRYRAVGLAPGAYTVRVRKRSFETVKVAELRYEGRLRRNFRIRTSPVVIS